MTGRLRRDDEFDIRDDNEDEEEDDGSRGIWAAFERETAGRPPIPTEIDVGSIKERLKRAARQRAGQPRDDAG
jgi:hypothetical protein